MSGLVEAAGRGHYRRVRRLLDRGADIEGRDEDGVTALTAAAVLGQREVVEFLLDRGADIEARNWWGFSPLASAALAGRRDVVECLLDRGANIEAHGGDNGDTALAAAARWAQRDIVEYLLHRGADIDSRDLLDRTALIAAAREGHTEVVECLLDGYPKWTGVTEEVQHLVGNIISRMIALVTTTPFVHGECSALVAPDSAGAGTTSHLLHLPPPPQSSVPWLDPPG
jgi:ankyrin repeat protein